MKKLKYIFIGIITVCLLFTGCNFGNGNNNVGGDSNTIKVLDFRNKLDGKSTYSRSAARDADEESLIVTEADEIVTHTNISDEDCKNLIKIEPDDEGLKITYTPPKEIYDLIVQNKAGYNQFEITYIDENWNFLTSETFENTYMPMGKWRDSTAEVIFPLVSPNETIKLYFHIQVWKYDESTKTRPLYAVFEGFYTAQAGNGGIGHMDSFNGNFKEDALKYIKTADEDLFELQNTIAPLGDTREILFTLNSAEDSQKWNGHAEWIGNQTFPVTEGSEYTINLKDLLLFQSKKTDAPYIFYDFQYKYTLAEYPETIFYTPSFETNIIENTFLKKDFENRGYDEVYLPGDVDEWQFCMSLQDLEDYINKYEPERITFYLDYETQAEDYYWSAYFPTPTYCDIKTFEIPANSPSGTYCVNISPSELDAAVSKLDNTKENYIVALDVSCVTIGKNKSVTITIKDTDDSILKEISIYPGKYYPLSEIRKSITKDDYLLTGLYFDKDFYKSYTTTTYKDITLYAKWSDEADLTKEKFVDFGNSYYSYIFRNLESYSSCKDAVIFITVKNTSAENKGFSFEVNDKGISISSKYIAAGETKTFTCKVSDFTDEWVDDNGHIGLRIYSNADSELVSAKVKICDPRTITLNYQNGTADTTITSYDGYDITSQLPTPTTTSADKLFAGWYTDSGCSTEFNGIVNGNTTLYAKWSDEVVLTKEKGEFVDISYYFYNFSNLETYRSCKDAVIFITVKNTSAEKKEFSFEVNDKGISISSKDIAAGETKTFTCKVSDFTDEWVNDGGHIGLSINSDADFELVSAKVKICAPRTITLNYQNGTVDTTITSYDELDITSQLPTPTSADKLFAGWYTDSSCSIEFNGIVNGDATLYAKWSDEVVLTKEKGEFVDISYYFYNFSNLETYRSYTNAVISIIVKNTSAEAKDIRLEVLSKQPFISSSEEVAVGETKTFTCKVADFTDEWADDDGHIGLRINSDVNFELVSAVIQIPNE